MDKKNSDLQVDAKFLKTYTNKFDLETIFVLNLPEKGINSVGSIPECSSLILLDLTQNNLKDVSMLGRLSKLQILKLGKNSITNIDNFKGLVSLLHLDLHGNQLKSVKNLQALTSLPSLQTLYLQTLDQQFKNPACDERDYRKNVLQLLPQLNRLDGVNRNQQFEFDAELPEIKKLEFNMDIPTQYWYTKEFPKVETSKEIKLDDAPLKNSLASCNKMIKELEDKIKSLNMS